MLSLGLSLDIETETEKVSVSVSILRLRKVKSRSRQRDWQSAYTGLGLKTPTLVSLIPGQSDQHKLLPNHPEMTLSCRRNSTRRGPIKLPDKLDRRAEAFKTAWDILITVKIWNVWNLSIYVCFHNLIFILYLLDWNSQ